jgi:N-acyl-D-amino-acid deacylase
MHAIMPAFPARHALAIATASLTLLAVVALTEFGRARNEVEPTFDLLIAGGRVVDGSGNPWFLADVAVRDGRVAAIGRLGSARAARVIDATGMVVAPGFIDAHGHVERSLEERPDAPNFLMMGVTSVITGNCGFSALPLAGWFERVQASGPGINVASLVGHNAVRRAGMGGDFDRPPSADELSRMRELVADSMREGAMGFSTGLEYVPGTYARTDELVSLARVSCEAGGLYASHMRDEGVEVESAIRETLEVGARAPCPVQISHFKISARNRWGDSAVTTGLVAEARARGEAVTIDQYAYTAASTGLDIIFPSWVFDGGSEQATERLTDPASRARVVRDMVQKAEGQGFDDFSFVQVARFEPDPSVDGKRLPEITRLSGGGDTVAAQAEQAIDMRLAGGAQLVLHKMSERDVDDIMRQPFTMFGSDSGVLDESSPGTPHPRGFGNNARVLGVYVRERGLLGLEEAIRKMTSLPAQTFRLWDRGLLRPGLAADIVVFDPGAVTDRATFDEPKRFATGMEYVIVNGRLAVDRGRLTGERAGTVVKKVDDGRSSVQPRR